MFTQTTRVQVNRTKIMATNDNAEKRIIREWRYSRRLQNLKKVYKQKCLTVGLALISIICMVLICTISYSSIKVQANSDFKYYSSITVESGDNLWNIADRYIDYNHYTDKESYIAEIENINHLDADDILLVGQLLIVPYYSAEYIE